MVKERFLFASFIDSIKKWFLYLAVIMLAAALGFFGIMAYLQFRLTVFFATGLAAYLPLLCLGTLAGLLAIFIVQRLILSFTQYVFPEKEFITPVVKKNGSGVSDRRCSEEKKELLSSPPHDEKLSQLKKIFQDTSPDRWTEEKLEALLDEWSKEEKQHWDDYQGHLKSHRDLIQRRYKEEAAQALEDAMRALRLAQSYWVELQRGFLFLQEEPKLQEVLKNFHPKLLKKLEQQLTLASSREEKEAVKSQQVSGNVPTSDETLRQQLDPFGHDPQFPFSIRERYTPQEQLRHLFGLPPLKSIAQAQQPQPMSVRHKSRLAKFWRTKTLTLQQQFEQTLEHVQTITAEQEQALRLEDRKEAQQTFYIDTSKILGTQAFFSASPTVEGLTYTLPSASFFGHLRYYIVEWYKERGLSVIVEPTHDFFEQVVEKGYFHLDSKLDSPLDLEHCLPAGCSLKIIKDKEGRTTHFIFQYSEEKAKDDLDKAREKKKIIQDTHSIPVYSYHYYSDKELQDYGDEWLDPDYTEAHLQSLFDFRYVETLARIAEYKEYKRVRDSLYPEERKRYLSAFEYVEKWIKGNQKAQEIQKICQYWLPKWVTNTLAGVYMSVGESYFERVITILEKMAGQTMGPEAKRLEGKTISLLKFFCSIEQRFGGLPFPSDKNIALQQIELMERIAHLSTDAEKDYFYAVFRGLAQYGYKQTIWRAKPTPQLSSLFVEYAEAVFRFFDFFKERSLPIVYKYHLDVLGRMRHIQGILELLDDKPEQQKIQAALLEYFPESLDLARDKIKGGYGFVVDAMFLGRYSHSPEINEVFEVEDSFFILPEELKEIDFKKINDFSDGQTFFFYKILFLRYIAWNVAPSKIKEIQEEWERLIPQDFFFNRKGEGALRFQSLQQHWVTLRNKAIALSTQKLRPVDDRKDIAQYDAVQRSDLPYNLKRGANILDTFMEDKDAKQISALWKGLTAEERVEIEKQLEELEKYKLIFSRKTENEFKTGLSSLKTRLRAKDAKDDKDNVPECLALLREAYYRHKRKWLRLEQVLVILINLKKDGLNKVETSEGKTLTLQMLALISALRDEKVDIITHSPPYAISGAAEIVSFARFLGLKVVSNKSSAAEVLEADILYTDIFSGVMDDLAAQLAPQYVDCKENFPMRGQRKKGRAYVDEIDAMMDHHVNTTMQLAQSVKGNVDLECETFLMLLTDSMDALEADLKIDNPDKLRRAMYEKLKDDPYYKKHWVHFEHGIDFWLNAAISAMELEEDRDFIVDKGQIKIVPYLTTGRVDEHSQWGNAVHQCVAARKKRDLKLKKKDSKVDVDDCVVIPAFSAVIGEGDIVTYLRKYPQLSGFSGTIGDEDTQKMLRHLFPKMRSRFLFPRAERPLPGNHVGPQYPLDRKQVTIFKRGYSVYEWHCDDRLEHEEKLFAVVEGIHQQNKSGIVFFDDIRACKAFAKLLLDKGIPRDKLQILDDTRDDDLRPLESIIVKNASKPGMITLATAAGGRATDFSGVDFAVLAMPGLERILQQQADRIARNGELGVIYRIYCWDDYDPETAQSAREAAVELEKKEEEAIVYHKSGLSFWSARKQAADLQLIRDREPLREFKQSIQSVYVGLPHKDDTLKAAWASFFSGMDRHWKGTPDSVKDFAGKCFTGTSWRVEETSIFS